MNSLTTGLDDIDKEGAENAEATLDQVAKDLGTWENIIKEIPNIGNGVGFSSGMTPDAEHVITEIAKGENANLIIDFKKEDLINEVILGFLESHDVWIFLPKKINVSFLDERLTVLKQDSLSIEQSKKAKPPNRKQFKIKNTNITCRYIEIFIENQGLCPAWHPGNGSHTWLFMDEISVN